MLRIDPCGNKVLISGAGDDANMKSPYLLLVLLAAVLGCNFFSRNSPDIVNRNIPLSSNTGATPMEITQDDFVGRWAVNRDLKDHFIEIRRDGTGTIVLDDRGKTQAKQDFRWTFENKAIVFTVNTPVVDPKSPDAGGLTMHARLSENGAKLQTDFSPYTRTRGEDAWDRK